MSAMEPASMPLDGAEAIAARTPSGIRATADEKQALHRSRTTDDNADADADGDIDGPGEPDTASEAPADEFPEGGYGWVVVLSVFLLNAHTWGLNSAYAVFLAYYLRTNSIGGSSDIAFAFVGGLSVSIAFLISPLATICVGRYGTRPTLLAGVFFETIGFIGASFTKQMWHLLLSQGIAFGIGMGLVFVPSVGLVPQWFARRRSFANSIATAGSGAGGLTWSLATNAMIQHIGLAWAFRIIAIVACVVNTVATFLARDRNKSVGAVHAAFDRTLFRRFEYYLLLSWGFFTLFGYTIVIFSLPDYAQTVGFTAAQGSIAGALFNLSQGLGRPVIGLVSDRIGRINVAALGTLIAGLAALFIWIFAGPYFGGLVVYSLMGCFAGLLWATVAPVTAEVVGIPLLPSALSIFWLVLTLPATFAEVIGLGLRTSGKDAYLHSQIFTGMCYIGAFISIWLLRAWKLHQLQDMHLSTAQREQEIRNGAVVTPDDLQKTSFGLFLLKGRWIFMVRQV